MQVMLLGYLSKYEADLWHKVMGVLCVYDPRVVVATLGINGSVFLTLLLMDILWKYDHQLVQVIWCSYGRSSTMTFTASAAASASINYDINDLSHL